ncbi:MAG: methyltransferase domain-containing protein [Alphaproteobacteria bacterium]|nr:methyltransferase domain-containing protein [Alphaproteobacteria bacterium]
MFVCPVTGGRLSSGLSPEGRQYPALDGIPVLVPDPDRFLARHGPGAWDLAGGLPTARYEDLPIDAPDAVTPHLPPRALGGRGGFAKWLGELGDRCPDAVCAAWGRDLAPHGRALDVGCGVGGMSRRMVTANRLTWAFDISPRAVLLTRDLLGGGITETQVPTHRGGLQRVRVPFAPIDSRTLTLCIADASQPPFPENAFAWIHLGNVLDMADDKSAGILLAASAMLLPGGLLTVSTPYDTDEPPVLDAVAPENELRETLGGLGLSIIDEDEHVPWVIREYDRGFRVMFSHCVAARRPTY